MLAVFGSQYTLPDQLNRVCNRTHCPQVRRLQTSRLARAAPHPAEVEGLIVRFARENSSWGYDRIVGALANLGQRNPARAQAEPKTTWKDFIAAHMAVLTGTDFFTVEVLTWRGLATYYVLFFIHLELRRITLAGLTLSFRTQPSG